MSLCIPVKVRVRVRVRFRVRVRIRIRIRVSVRIRVTGLFNITLYTSIYVTLVVDFGYYRLQH